MRGWGGYRTGLALVVAAAALGLGGPVQAGGDPEAGKRLAVKWCARCHMVGRDVNYHGGIDSTPWFETFARKPKVYLDRLRTFTERPPHPPQNIDVDAGEIDDLIAYIKSLKPE